MSLNEKIIESTKEIFTSMIMMDIEVAGDINADSPTLEDSISGVIGLAGRHKGVLAVHLPFAVARAITGSFLGMDVEEINEDVEDAIGEVANMLGGSVKAILTEKGRDIELSLPSTIIGRNYDFQSSKDAQISVIPFQCESGMFYVEVQLEK